MYLNVNLTLEGFTLSLVLSIPALRDRTIFGAAVREGRRGRKLSLEVVCTEIGVSNGQMADIESGKRFANSDRAAHLIRYLDLAPSLQAVANTHILVASLQQRLATHDYAEAGRWVADQCSDEQYQCAGEAQAVANAL